MSMDPNNSNINRLHVKGGVHVGVALLRAQRAHARDLLEGLRVNLPAGAAASKTKRIPVACEHTRAL